MQIITFCSFKGGTAKTSSCLNISCYLSINHKKKILLIDADPQANLTTGLGFDNYNKNLLHDLLNKEVNILDVIYKTKFDNLDIISSSMLLDDLVFQKHGNFASFCSNLKKINHLYDFCVIDTPPNFGLMTKWSLEVSNAIAICSTLDPLSILGISKMNEFLQKMVEDKPSILGIILSFWDKRNSTNQMYMDIIESIFSNKIFKNKIRRDVYISRSFLKEKPVFLAYPNSRGTMDFSLLAEEFYSELKTLKLCEV